MSIPNTDKTTKILNFELSLNSKERARLLEQLEDLAELPLVVATEPQPALNPRFKNAIALDPFVPTLVVLAVNARDIVAVVKILLQIAQDRQKGEKDIRIKIGSTTLKVPGDSHADVEVIVNQLGALARVVTKPEVQLEIERIRMEQVNKEIAVTRSSIEMYERYARELSECGNLNKWQEERLKWAQKNLYEFSEKLKKLLDQSSSEK